MLWYLLYPLRGTTQPPRLAPNHPIRRAFYRHGKLTAQHWLVAMLASVAIAMGFSFPTIFLSENPTAGFAAYPHHVWTTAKPYDGDPVHIDVEMRQVWVHGNYMKALDKDVLKRALMLQEVLVGGENLTSIFPTLSEKLRESTLSWGYHSPLMYWNSSEQMIDDDPDILKTINTQSRTSSSLNVALRPASVFAGKIFDRRDLKAADALVLTFMNKVDENVGSKWQNKLKSLTERGCTGCQLFPFDGDVTRNRAYEFSFMPLSVQENLALGFAYSGMALYVLISLRRLKAFHSRFGLVVTAITQMTCSVLASFTICGILKINLSMIPQNAYPFVVLVIGLENMFRLINAILAYPATMATDQRIANALGDVGPVSVATAAQNLIILVLLASFVSPGVMAFCAFACIATLFDVFFLLTFFVAVLNVDIRRLELQDALARSNHHHRTTTTTTTKANKKPPPSQHTWFDALVRGRLPFSTRMAGTAVTTTFILSLNYHFFERHEKVSNLRHLLGLARGGPKTVAEFDTFTPPPMNATLTPGEWMRMQDFDTAREVMRLAKPGADTFIIRVFAPLIVVLSGADRTGAPLGTEAWTHALSQFAIHHFYPVAVAVVFAVAFVAVLMNFLLYSEAGEEEDGGQDERGEEQALGCRTLGLPHRLDIVKVAGNGAGHFVSVALDRTIAVAVFDRVQKGYTSLAVPAEVLGTLRWPVHAAVVDDGGEFVACHCADERVVIYSTFTGRLVGEGVQYPDDNPAVLFRFVQLPAKDGLALYFVILTSGGRLLATAVENGSRDSVRLSDIPLLGGAVLEGSSGSCRLLVATEQSRIIAYQWAGGVFTQSISQQLPVSGEQGRLVGSVDIAANSELGPESLVVTAANNVVILDSTSLAMICKLPQAPGPTAKLVLGEVASCPVCGSAALRSFACVTPLPDNGFAVTASSVDGEDAAPMCLRKAAQGCRAVDSVPVKTHEVSDSGEWAVVNSHAVVGLRRRPKQANGSAPTNNHKTSTSVRHRRRTSLKPQESNQETEWQAYRYGIDGEMETLDVPTASAETGDETALYVHNAGPTTPLGSHSIAVAFGNTVKVIRASQRGTARRRSHEAAVNGHAATSRRRLTLRKAL